MSGLQWISNLHRLQTPSLSKSHGNFNIVCDNDAYLDHDQVTGHIAGSVFLPICAIELHAALTCTFQYTDANGVQQQRELFRDDYIVWSGSQLEYGEHTIPFGFLLPGHLPASISWPMPPDTMVVWHMHAFLKTDETQELVKLARAVFRKATIYRPTPQFSPQAGQSKNFLLSGSHQLYCHVELDKDVYYRGEAIKATYRIHNESSRAVTCVLAGAYQRDSLSGPGLVSHEYLRELDMGEYSKDCPIQRNQVVTHLVHLRPLSSYSADTICAYGPGCARSVGDAGFDGIENRLASTTIYREPSLDGHGVNFRLTYEVHIRCVVRGGHDLVVVVPFVLSDPPNPDEDMDDISHISPPTNTNCTALGNKH